MAKTTRSMSAKKAAKRERKQAKMQLEKAPTDEENDPQEDDLTDKPSEPRKQAKPRYFLFTMKGDKEDAFIAGSKRAAIFLQ